jgi:hypothetical protein
MSSKVYSRAMPSTTLSLREVADLAHVQRAVVSTWRRRPRVRGRSIPFPQPVATADDVADGVERFSRDEIVAWLTDTGRGNNPEALLDARALAVPAAVAREDVVVLLSLYARAGGEFARLSSDDLIALAERVDPSDEFALREVRALDPSPALLGYTDDLIENSFGPADAYERLGHGRLGWESESRGLSPEVVDLLSALARAARDATGGRAALLVTAVADLAWQLWQGHDAAVCPDDDTADARAQRRRAAILELTSGSAVGEVRIVSVVGRGDGNALDLVSEADLTLGPTDLAVVVGSAALLCDRLVGELEKQRSYVLRSGHLAMALRLPRGLWKGAHRQSLGVWVLHGDRSGKTTRVADLSDVGLDRDDLCADLTAALTDNESRAFRYARIAQLDPVLAGAAVVPRGIRAVTWGRTDISHLDAVYAASLVTAERITGFDVAAAPGTGRIVLNRRSLGELAAAGVISVRHGNRIDLGSHDPAGTVRVITADGSADLIRLEPFAADRRYPRAVRTEPGDVIIAQTPRPIARVDTHGGGFVLAPSKLVRLGPAAGVGPQLLAALINQLDAAPSEWQNWTVPEIAAGEAESLEAVLASAATHLDMLRRHVSALQDLTTHLIAGVAAGAVRIEETITKKAG